MKNIYAQLGAQPTNLGLKLLDPCYCPDGSTSESTKKWALEKLGFISNESVVYDSWCEPGDRSAIVPYAAKSQDVKIWLSPISEQPAYFKLVYGYVNVSKLKLDRVYHITQIGVAFQDAKNAIEDIKSRYPEDMRVDNPRFDSRCEWDEINKTWVMSGRSCKFQGVNLGDGTNFMVPIF